MHATYRCWAEIDLEALRDNLGWIRHRVGPDVKVMTVVKADAYGHGLKQIAALLMQSGTDIFGVANLREAESIRSVGEGWPILMLGSCLPHEVSLAIRDGIHPTISCFEEAAEFSKAASRLGKTVQAHLKVDTGMGRLGALPEQVTGLVSRVAALPHLQLAGLFTHFANSEDSAQYTRRQIRLFRDVLKSVHALGISVPSVHCCNSGGLLHELDSCFNLVRPGLLVYGIIPPGKRQAPKALEVRLRPALSLKCRVTLARELSPGTSISYGCTYRTKRKARVAVLSAGYGDGYPRAGSNRGFALVRGQRCPILGRITMDQMIVDVSKLSEVARGDEAVLIGRQGKDCISASEAAGWCGTIPWEMLTNITYRVPRLYLGGVAS
jgi:alanine racemase